MARSLLVIGALVAVLFFAVPRGDRIAQPAIDVQNKAAWTVKESGWPIELPEGFASNWRATTATYAPGVDAKPTFTVVYQNASEGDEVVTIRQAKDSPGWVAESLGDAQRRGEVTIEARKWQTWWSSRLSRSYLVSRGDLTIVITGTGTQQRLEEVAGKLRRVPAAG